MTTFVLAGPMANNIEPANGIASAENKHVLNIG